MRTGTKTLLTLAAVGVGAYYLFFRKGSAGAPSAQTQTAAASAGRPLGDPTDPNSVAYACNTGWKLTALGHPTEAAFWITRCQAGGGTVPGNAGEQYTT